MAFADESETETELSVRIGWVNIFLFVTATAFIVSLKYTYLVYLWMIKP
jgi:hypothetical protein